MGFSINDIMAHINENFFAKPNLYEVRIYGPSMDVGDMPERVIMNCCAATVPGVNVGLFQDIRYGVGLRQMIATAKNFTELNLSFYESQNESERQYFVDWMEKIYDRTSRRMNYPKEYKKNMEIIQYGKDGKRTYVCRIFDVFPSNVSPLDRSYNNHDQVPQFNVNLQLTDVKEFFGPDFEEPVGFTR